MYAGNPFSESLVIADYLSRHSTPDQQIAVLGSEPQLYFYAKRTPPQGTFTPTRSWSGSRSH